MPAWVIGDTIRLMMGGQPFAHLRLHVGVFWIVREVLPFPAILLVIVEFFGSVSVRDVAVAIGSKAIVFVAEDGQRRFLPLRVGIAHQGREIITFQLIFRGRAAGQEGEGRIDIEQVHRPGAGRSRFHHARRHPYQIDPCGSLSERVLCPTFFFAQLESMIAPQDDDRVVGVI